MSSPDLPALAARMATSAAVVVLASRPVERAGPVLGALPLGAVPAAEDAAGHS